jgi:predicted acetyltransferase
MELQQVELKDKAVLRQMLQLYQYDFSEIEGTELNADGFYEYRYLDLYWSEEGRTPFFIRENEQLAGFVLVNRHTLVIKAGWCLAEFFILRKYRRRQLGRAAAFAAFDRFRGEWEVRQTRTNVVAQAFWKKTIGAYTSERYQLLESGCDPWPGPILTFKNGPS